VNNTTLVMRDTLRELSHRKLIVGLAIAAVGLTALAGQLVSWQLRAFEAVVEQAERTPQHNGLDPKQVEAVKESSEQVPTFLQAQFFGLAGLGGVVVTLFIFSTLLAVPLKQKELRSVLARPVTRASYLGGRAAAGVVMLAAFWLLMSLGFVVFFMKQGRTLPPMMWSAPVLLFLKCAMLGMIALATSLYVRPPFLAAVLTFLVSSDWVSSQGLLYLILPGDDRLSIGAQILHGRLLGLHDVSFASAYAVAIGVAAFCAALLRFRRMEVP
jgi:ABC-type transport system involved in multi-copper enzyme maturation permease subunit